MANNEEFYSWTEIELIGLFSQSSGPLSTRSPKDDWYWPHIQRIIDQSHQQRIREAIQSSSAAGNYTTINLK